MTTRAKNSRVSMAYIKESTFGEKVTIGAAKKLRFAGESLEHVNETVDSNEIRDDRQSSGADLVGIGTSGSINAELSFGTYDDLFEGAFFSAGWSSPVTVTATTISLASADNSINDSANGFGGISANQWIKLSGTTGNDAFYKVVTASASKLVVSHGTLTDESAGVSITVVQGSQIVNGITKSSYNLQRRYTDLTDEFATFVGQVVKGTNIAFALRSLITANFDFIGKQELEDDTAQIGDSYDSSTPTTTKRIKTTKSIKGLFENGAKISGTDFSVSLENNCYAVDELSEEIGAIDIDEGELVVTGNLKAYYTSSALYNKYRKYQDTNLAIVTKDKVGNVYIIDLPDLNFTKGTRTAPNKSGGVMADLQYTAKASDTEGITIRMVRFPIA